MSGSSRLLAPKRNDKSTQLSCVHKVKLQGITCLLQAVELLVKCICASSTRSSYTYSPPRSGVHPCMPSLSAELKMALACLQGQEALCLAIYHHSDVVRILLSHGANANSRDQHVRGFHVFCQHDIWQAFAARAQMFARSLCSLMFSVSF